MRSFNYYIGEAFKGLARNSLMAASSAATVASCIFMLIASVCVALNVDYVLQQFENKVGISVFIADDVTADGVKGLYEAISAIPHVESVEFVSSEEALRQFAAMYDSSDEVIRDLEQSNPLRRSFTVGLEGGRYQNEVLDTLLGKHMKDLGIANVSHMRDSINALVSVNNVVRVVAVILIGVLAMLSVIIIMNTIRLTVNSRRNEIVIMRYVGATNWFIKWPFVIEGMIIGLIGAGISSAVCWPLYARVVNMAVSRVPVLDRLVEMRPAMYIFPVLMPLALGLGVVIGIIGSTTSMRRHLGA